MIKHRHMLAGATLVTALFGSAFPAHAGLIGGAGGIGVGLNGSLSGQGTLQTPPPRPVVDRAQDKADATKERAEDTAGAAKDRAAAARGRLQDAAQPQGSVSGSAAASAAKPALSTRGTGRAEATTRKGGVAASAEGDAATDGRSTTAGGSANGSVQR
jgi:hypothetical protein